MINTKRMTKNSFKELLSELKYFKYRTILVLNNKKRNNCKVLHLSAKHFAEIQTLTEHLNLFIKAL